MGNTKVETFAGFDVISNEGIPPGTVLVRTTGFAHNGKNDIIGRMLLTDPKFRDSVAGLREQRRRLLAALNSPEGSTTEQRQRWERALETVSNELALKQG